MFCRQVSRLVFIHDKLHSKSWFDIAKSKYRFVNIGTEVLGYYANLTKHKSLPSKTNFQHPTFPFQQESEPNVAKSWSILGLNIGRIIKAYFK